MRHDLRRRECLGFIALTPLATLASGAPVVSPASPASDLRDCMPDFWIAYDAGRDRELPARAQALVESFFRAHANEYRQAGIVPTLPRVTAWLPQFDAMASDVRALDRRFNENYSRNLDRFRAALPDFDGRASPVGVLPSLFHFDAHLQPDGPLLPLFFGPDGIQRFHGSGADLGVLFAHELFHCYQAQKNPSMSLDPLAPVFESLWIEGVATYASERMNPGSSLLHVLLDDTALAGADDATLKRVARSLIEQLDATDDATQVKYFSHGYQGDWPSRAGYYVGLLAARRLGETMTLQQMAALPTPRVRELLDKTLRALVA